MNKKPAKLARFFCLPFVLERTRNLREGGRAVARQRIKELVNGLVTAAPSSTPRITVGVVMNGRRKAGHFLFGSAEPTGISQLLVTQNLFAILLFFLGELRGINLLLRLEHPDLRPILEGSLAGHYILVSDQRLEIFHFLHISNSHFFLLEHT